MPRQELNRAGNPGAATVRTQVCPVPPLPTRQRQKARTNGSGFLHTNLSSATVSHRPSSSTFQIT